MDALFCLALLGGCLWLMGCGILSTEAGSRRDELAKKLKELQGSANLPEEARVLHELALSYLDSAEDALADWRWWRALRLASKGLAAVAKAKHRLDCSPANAANGLASGTAAEAPLEAGSDQGLRQPTADGGTCVA